MSRKKRQTKGARAREEPQKKRATGAWLCSPAAFDTLACAGYTSLSHNPEIAAGVDVIARLIASMTIHLMENTPGGDVRIQNELSRKIDIQPNDTMTRSTLIHWVVKTLLLEGNGNAVVYPETRRGLLRNLRPIPPAMVSFLPEDAWGYRVSVNGKNYDPDRVLHFVWNPDPYYPWMGTGYRVSLSEVANNLKQAAATEKGFLSSKWKPSLIVKVDALSDEFASPEGRERLLESYVSGKDGEPWLIPAEQFSVEQVKPLTLADLALSDMVTLDKRTVAAILGVPPFVLGVGEFHREQWNNFINATIMPLARMLEQELTRKLLVSPSWFFRFNSWSLFSYSITELVTAGAEMVDRMALRRNEWRSWVNMPPDPEMEELLALENYLPADRLGDQGKLVQGGE